MEPGIPVPVVITAFADRSFTFVTKTPPNSYFLMKAAGVEKGSQTTGKGSTVGRVTMAQIREIAETKMPDLNAKDLDGACRMLIGSARSMGLEVVE
jgi:large subunit ribosomal protein L11